MDGRLRAGEDVCKTVAESRQLVLSMSHAQASREGAIGGTYNS